MKKALLAAALLAFGPAAMAQCTPNPLYADSVFGVWPDTLTDFMPGNLGVFYSDTLNLIVPTQAQDINPNLPNVSIDSVKLVTITNLPPGLSVACNSQTSAPCTFLPQMLGCGLIEGIPTQAGTFDMILNVTGYSNIGGFPIPFNQAFPGYTIVIGAVGIPEVATPAIAEVRNVPNPFADRTSIEYRLRNAGPVEFVVYDLLGEQVSSAQWQGRAGLNKQNFDGSALQGGIYLYKLSSGGATFTGRMVLHR